MSYNILDFATVTTGTITYKEEGLIDQNSIKLFLFSTLICFH